MEKIKYNENVDKVIDKLTGSKILRHTCQLLKKNDNGKLAPHASGVFVKIGGIHFLLTASHVVEDWSDENHLFIRIGLDKYVPLAGGVRETDIDKSQQVDVAYIRINERIIEVLEKLYLFLPISKIRDHKRVLNATQYCIMGYPEKSKKEHKGRVESFAQAFYVYPSKGNVYEHYKFNPVNFYLFEMKGKGFDIKTGNKKKIDTHFYGMSGCGLWLILLNSNGTSYSVDYRLIGIMSEFRKGKYFSMIGVKIAIILQALQRFEGIKI